MVTIYRRPSHLIYLLRKERRKGDSIPSAVAESSTRIPSLLKSIKAKTDIPIPCLDQVANVEAFQDCRRGNNDFLFYLLLWRGLVVPYVTGWRAGPDGGPQKSSKVTYFTYTV